jgi:hypothetical protein
MVGYTNIPSYDLENGSSTALLKPFITHSRRDRCKFLLVLLRIVEAQAAESRRQTFTPLQSSPRAQQWNLPLFLSFLSRIHAVSTNCGACQIKTVNWKVDAIVLFRGGEHVSRLESPRSFSE